MVMARRIILILLGIVIGIAAVVYLLHANPKPMMMLQSNDEGEERPPVVVSSGGSIRFEAQDYGFGHGEWTLSGSNKMAKYDLAGKAPVQRFDLYVSGATCSPTSTATVAFDVKEMDIDYVSGADTNGVKISIDGDQLKAQITSEKKPDEFKFTDDPKNKYVIVLQKDNHDWHLQKVSFKSKTWFLGGYTNQVSCDLTAGSELGVFQRDK
jgi:hypothetical protein